MTLVQLFSLSNLVFSLSCSCPFLSLAAASFRATGLLATCVLLICYPRLRCRLCVAIALPLPTVFLIGCYLCFSDLLLACFFILDIYDAFLLVALLPLLIDRIDEPLRLPPSAFTVSICYAAAPPPPASSSFCLFSLYSADV